MRRWLFSPVPKGRIAAFRTLIYLFVAADLVFFTSWVHNHAAVPGNLYKPLLVGRLLHLPTPTPTLVNSIFWILLPVSIAAATARFPRLLGWTVFVLYFEWMIIAMSYGKIDHDRLGLLLALATLPTAGPARHGDEEPTEAGGWALRMTQLGVVATYFLASWAKLRFGGLDWLTGATLARAVIRRGTWLGHLVVRVPHLMQISQFGIVAFELTSPLVFFVKPRVRYAMVFGFYLFHLVTVASITISFIPHQVAMTSFLPLEKVRPWALLRRQLARRRAAGQAVAVAGDPVVDRPGQRDQRAEAEQSSGRSPESRGVAE
jgi:hypothetical protein